MIVGVGMDLVSITRIRGMVERRSERALGRLYTAGEIAYCRGRGAPEQSFAARFAAKEAFFKALGTGWSRGGLWTEVEVCTAPGGAPQLVLSGRAARNAEERGVVRLHLSLTHSDDTAGAVVVLEG
jgi:holo-[acyl-carrier protein] synthase